MSRTKSDSLTQKQFTVLQLSAQGLTGKEIADQMGISLKAIVTHKHWLFKKLGAKSCPHAVYIAMKRGILT